MVTWNDCRNVSQLGYENIKPTKVETKTLSFYGYYQDFLRNESLTNVEYDRQYILKSFI